MINISSTEISRIASNPKTSDDYSKYLKNVLVLGKRITESLSRNIDEVNFLIDKETGIIYPFGERGFN